MEKLIIKKTEETPAIIFIPEKGIFQLAGRSWPENPEPFYTQIIDWLKEYFLDPLPETVFEIRLSYFNTSTSKQITRLFLFLKSKSKEHNVRIKWVCNKDDIESINDAMRFMKLLGLEDIMEIAETDNVNPIL